MINDILNSFISLTDDALSHWANPGILRRARKKSESSNIIYNETEDGIQILVDDYKVFANKPGLNELKCNCPATGPCIHKIMIVLWLRDQNLGQNLNECNNNLKDKKKIKIDQKAIRKDLGKSLAEKGFSLLKVSNIILESVQYGGMKVIFSPNSVHCVYHPGQYWKDMFCSIGGNEQIIYKAASILFYLKEKQLLDEKIWNDCLGDAISDSNEGINQSEKQKQLYIEISSILLRISRQGIFHLNYSVVELLSFSAIKARSLKMKKIGSIVSNLSSKIELLIKKEEGDTYNSIITIIISLYILCINNETLIESLDETDLINIDQAFFLGCNWWENENGSRGLTGYFLNLLNNKIISKTVARPAHTDPKFARSGAYHNLSIFKAGHTGEFFQKGAFSFTNLSITKNGEVKSSKDVKVRKTENNLSYKYWNKLLRNDFNQKDMLRSIVPMFNLEQGLPILIKISKYQTPVLDEMNRCLNWNVYNSNKDKITLKIPYKSQYKERMHNLITMERDPKCKIIAALVKGGSYRNNYYWELITLIGSDGASVFSISLDFIDLPHGNLDSQFINWLSRIEKKREVYSVASKSDSIIKKFIGDILSVLYTPIETGRTSFSISQIDILKSYLEKCEIFGWEQISNQIEGLLDIMKKNNSYTVDYNAIFHLIKDLNTMQITSDLIGDNKIEVKNDKKNAYRR